VNAHLSPAAVARKSHGYASAVRAGVTLWYPVVAPIGFWAIHLVFIAGYVRFSCTQPSTQWALHAVTAVTAAGALLGIALAARLVRRSHGDESTDTEDGRGRFLGYLGLASGVINLALILLEEAYVLGFHATNHCL
jgi:hypothetical protein